MSIPLQKNLSLEKAIAEATGVAKSSAKKSTASDKVMESTQAVSLPQEAATAFASVPVPVSVSAPDEVAHEQSTLYNSKDFDPKPNRLPKLHGRADALDIARGFAVMLMILSHGVKGLMMLEQMPDWGLVPIHLVTKFSSSLFILVFGMTLAISFAPSVDTPEWPKKRKKLWLRGVQVFFWYKALTILEMSHLYGRDEVWDALLYRSFPVYCEVLGFYSLALLWAPLVLPLWKRSPAVVRWLMPLIAYGIYAVVSHDPDFFRSETLQALLIEHPNHYSWGQLARAPLVFLGLLLGWLVQVAATTKWPRLLPFGILGGVSLTLFGWFLVNAGDSLSEALILIAKNAGKHPPELQFMLFSLGGAFMIIALSILGGKAIAKPLGFVVTLGKNSLQAFVFHIAFLFVFYRYLFDYFHKVEYTYALFLGCLLIVLTWAWVKSTKWVWAHS